MKTFGFILAALALFTNAYGADEGFRPATVGAVRIDALPVIDGKLNDSCWKEAIEVASFHLVGTSIPAKYPTRMMLVWTPDALFFGFHCAKKKAPFKISATPYGLDGDVFRDDSIELFLQPDLAKPKYYQFITNALGSRYDGTGRDRSWDGSWRAAVAKTDTGWSLEGAISFSTFSAQKLKSGDRWGISIVRNEKAYRETSCWNDLADDFHNPRAFGHLLFADPLAGRPRMALTTGDGMSLLYISPQSVKTEAAGVKSPLKLALADRLNIVNASFEMGLHRWVSAFPKRTYKTSPVSIDRSVSATGKASLLIESVNPYAMIEVAQSVVAPPVGRFEVECLLKLSDTSQRGKVVLFADQGARGYRKNLGVKSLIVTDEILENGWVKRAVRFTAPPGFVRVGVEVSGYRGKVWVDGFRSRKVARPERPMDGIWYWDATWNGDGTVARRRLFAMVEKKSPFIKSAKNFNDALLDAAFALDRGKRLERVSHYLGKPVRTDLAARMNEIYSGLDGANRAYANAYVDGKPETLPGAVDAPLKKAEANIKSMNAEISRAENVLKAEAEKKFGRWPAPPAFRPEPDYKITPAGLPNQMMFGTWGKWQYKEMASRLGIWKLTSNDGVGFPGTCPDGSLTWDRLLKYIKTVSDAGVPYFGVRTRILAGRDTYVSPGFARAHRNSPDYLTGKRWNFWRPAVVGEQKRILVSLARQMKDMPGVLFHQFAWESSGPQWLDKTATDPKTSSGLAAFHGFLRKSYAGIDALNRAWKSRYRDFAEILPVTDLREHASPLRYEYQRWRQESYMDLLKTLYETLKKEDPDKPVLSSHTRLLGRIDPTRIFETCDLLDAHGPDRNVPINLYLASNAKLAGKQVCKFENFWQYQDDTVHWGNERVQFAAMAKYLYRCSLMGMRLQFYCFPYTSQSGWNWRQAQWTQVATDYTTLRHAACAMPVAKRSVRELEDVFLHARGAPSDILVVFPRTSFLHQAETHYDEMREVVKALHTRNFKFEFRSEARIESGGENLNDYKAIVLLRSPFLADGVENKLAAWVKDGGTLVTLGAAGVYDKYGFDAGKLMRGVTGVVPQAHETPWREVLSWDFGSTIGAPAFLDKALGKGRVFIINMGFNDFLLSQNDAEKMFSRLSAAAPPAFACPGDLFELWPLVTEKGDTFLGVLNKNSFRDVTGDVIIRRDVKRVTDWSVSGGFPVPLKKTDAGVLLSVKLQPGGLAMLRLSE